MRGFDRRIPSPLFVFRPCPLCFLTAPPLFFPLFLPLPVFFAWLQSSLPLRLVCGFVAVLLARPVFFSPRGKEEITGKMEAENRSMRMLMQRLPKKWFALLFVAFFVLFLVALIAGAAGPYMYDRRELSTWDCPEGWTTYEPAACSGVDLTQPGTTFTGVIRNLDRLNQELILRMTPTQAADHDGSTISTILSLSIAGRDSEENDWKMIKDDDFHDREITCKTDAENCDNLTVGHLLFINYAQYQFNVSLQDVPANSGIQDIIFTFYYVNHSYTLYELWWRFVFLILNFVALLVFAHRLRRFQWREWTIEQQWTVVLLFGLMGFNNPFFPLELLTEGWFPIFLNRALIATFVSLVLLYWLVVSDGVRREDAERDTKRFYLPKVILLGIFWVTGIATFTWAELHRLDDPQYHGGLNTIPGFILLRVLNLICIIVYVFWLVYCACRACGDSKVMPYLGTRIKVFFGLSLFVLIVIVGGIIFGWQLGSSSTTAAEFLAFQALLNLYVYVLAVCYTPTKDAAVQGPSARGGADDRTGMIRLEEDSYSDGEGGAFAGESVRGLESESGGSDPEDDSGDERHRRKKKQSDGIELDTIVVGLDSD
jgi:Wntless-like, transmembrane domain/TMEM181, GOLD domain